MARTRLLIISKYGIMRTALRYFLSSMLDVDIAGEVDTLQKAEQLIPKLNPDAVLVETTASSSLSTAQLGERIKRLARVPIVILGTDESPRFVRAMFKAGVAGYVLKGSSDAELLSALRSVARGRKFLDSCLLEAVACERAARPRRTGRTDKLSKRELQVAMLLIQGYTSPQAASALHLSVKTIDTYRSRLYEKLELRDRADLVQYAVTSGLISVHKGLSEES